MRSEKGGFIEPSTRQTLCAAEARKAVKAIRTQYAARLRSTREIETRRQLKAAMKLEIEACMAVWSGPSNGNSPWNLY